MMAIGMLPVGSLAAGIVAEHSGARITVFCSGVLCLAAALVIYRNRSHLEAVKEQE
jgi:predicted MFS family arabinose efflux permease